MVTPHTELRDLKDQQQYDFTTEIDYAHQSRRGLGEDVVRSISALKNEPQWMLDFRLKALDIFNRMPMPTWGVDLGALDFEEFYYFMRATPQKARTWDDVPDAIKDTFDKLGIPEAERKFLAGVETQMDSEAVYSSLKAEWERHGIIFVDMDTAVQKYPDLVRKYISTVVPIADNKFAALNSAFWSGGSFVYVPPGVDVEIPLQAYFRINAQSLGQFERTIIIAEEGSSVHYIEGCTAPQYTTAALHTGVIEIFVGKGARARYTTIQNWSTNVYNLVTQRALVEEDGSMSWVDGNMGSGITMKYPAVVLKGPRAHGEVLSIAFAGDNQHYDAGAKAIHLAPHTSSLITSKSISKGNGRADYRGLVRIAKGAVGAQSKVTCDALLLDPQSRTDTYPYMDVNEDDAHIEHEATVSKISEDQLFYLMSRGLPEKKAAAMIVSGFLEPFVKELPMEYAVELNRLIDLQMEGSVG
ncbi:MAG TPA: Fe-S cluster assembly protein SufB [Anaerolineae bacterium]|nr:Fe-S cluster assembly protein SufB [Anaerolineae bacterium]HQK12512.1 Fe-S cluster assembly protein SufB [Anaerolineae bacterium]